MELSSDEVLRKANTVTWTVPGIYACVIKKPTGFFCGMKEDPF